MGIFNEYGIIPMMDINVPRGSEYSNTVSMYNPNKDKRIHIHRVGTSDDNHLDIMIAFHSEMGMLLLLLLVIL